MMSRFKLVLLAFVAIASGFLNIVYAEDSNYANRPAVKSFIAEMNAKHQFNQDKLSAMFAEAEKQNKVIELMNRQAESKEWYQYRPIFISEERARNGAAFWDKYKTELDQAHKRYGVPPEIIVAIIGAETSYGTNVGSFPVFDTLTTLAFDYPRRAPFFRNELVEYLIMTRDENLDAMEIKGSYAGAMGPPQFMPSSYRAYAVDYEGNDNIDLLTNMEDAIVSVANYLKRNGWKSEESFIAVRAKTKGNGYHELISKELRAGTDVIKPQKPFITVEALEKYGVYPATPVPESMKVSIIELKNENSNEYWLGFNNFYAITRYNHSNMYAMAVYQLSQEILKYHQ
jgi:membrane-bound lytic murein transglycosylase B